MFIGYIKYPPQEINEKIRYKGSVDKCGIVEYILLLAYDGNTFV